jgi:hypothetical protein
VTVDHTDLLRALEAAGFDTLDQGVRVLVYWPAPWDRRTSVMPTTPAADGYRETIDAWVADLESLAERGRVAQLVLDALEEPHGMGLR